ncbi:fibronectin type III-like domain-contianing protein [Streptomyces sp. NPDC000888]
MVSARVRNTRVVSGAETVQLYAVDPVAQVTRPVRSLLGFSKVSLAPGEQATVRFGVHTDRLAFTGLGGRRHQSVGGAARCCSVPTTPGSTSGWRCRDPSTVGPAIRWPWPSC